jgi:hypothetical protein
MSRRITYILGAGASYNALPVVDEMNDWINSFIFDIGNIFKGDKDIDINYWKDLVNKIKQHSSIDTYAKKLTLQNNQHQLSDLKNLISSFLLFQQTWGEGKSHILKNSLSNEDVKNNRDSNSLDYRYDSLLAGILVNENGKVKIPDNINIISWNYDIQLELSYMNYRSNSIPEVIQYLQTIDDFTYKNIFSNGEKLNLKESKHIKLNGVALPLINNKIDDLTDKHIYNRDSIYPIVKDLLKTTRTSYHTTLSFAWEKKNLLDNEVLKFAQSVLASSSDIVIIGYSFPFFNRDIDRYLFDSFRLANVGAKKIYLQSHENHVERLKSDFLGIFPFLNTKTNSHIITESNLSQFVIPYDY